MLTFDSLTHTYRWNGVAVPGVSEILKATGQTKDWADVPSYYRDRGAAVHMAIEMWIRGTLDETSLDPVIVQYIEQFKEWAKREMRAGVLLTETPLYSEKMGFAGTVDLIVDQTIYDIKCSKKLDRSSEWQYSLQGAGYRTLVREKMSLDLPFKVLLLTGGGPAVEVEMVAPFKAWEHVVGLYDIKMQRIVVNV